MLVKSLSGGEPFPTVGGKGSPGREKEKGPHGLGSRVVCLPRRGGKKKAKRRDHAEGAGVACEPLRWGKAQERRMFISSKHLRRKERKKETVVAPVTATVEES